MSHLWRKFGAAVEEWGYGTAHIEGSRKGDWVLIDAGDVVVHIFRAEVRAYYDLEGMWSVDEWAIAAARPTRRVQRLTHAHHRRGGGARRAHRSRVCAIFSWSAPGRSDPSSAFFQSDFMITDVSRALRRGRLDESGQAHLPAPSHRIALDEAGGALSSGFRQAFGGAR
jgi:hypothetical protein